MKTNFEYSGIWRATDDTKMPFAGTHLYEWLMRIILSSHWLRFCYVFLDNHENLPYGWNQFDGVREVMLDQVKELYIKVLQDMIKPVSLPRKQQIMCMLLDSHYPLRAPWDLDRAVTIYEQDRTKVVWAALKRKDGTPEYIPGMSCWHWEHILKLDPEKALEDQVDRPGCPGRVPVYLENWQNLNVAKHPKECEALFIEKILGGTDDAKPFVDYQLSVQTEFEYVQNADAYNRGVEQNILPFDYRNSFFNHYRIFTEIENGTAADIQTAKLDKPMPALCFGSGPSLDEAYPYLKDWKGGVFCSTSQALTLIHAGLDPQYIIAYDVMTQWTELEPDELWGPERKSTLITHPGCHPHFLNKWPLKKLYFREMDSSNPFYTKAMPAAYGDRIQSQMFLFSCSVSAQMSLAHFMGYAPIFLVGCDFAAGRFRRHAFKDGEWTIAPEQCKDFSHFKVIKGANGVVTNSLQAFYKRSVICVWRIDHSNCFQTTNHSLISEMPMVPLEDVIASQGLGYEKMYLTHQQIEDIAEIYLARHNQFIVRFDHGKSVKVVEAHEKNWVDNVEGYLKNIHQVMIQNSDDPRALDIPENMARFRWLKEQINAKDNTAQT